MTDASRMLCFSVKRKSIASSSRFMEAAAAATAMLVRLIILPITPPAELAAAIRTGFMPSLLAVTTCMVPNKALAEVSLPVRKTPSQPSIALKIREHRAGGGKGLAKRGGSAGVIHQVRQSQHGGESEFRQRELFGRMAQGAAKLAERQPGDDRAQNRREEARRPGSGKPVEVIGLLVGQAGPVEDHVEGLEPRFRGLLQRRTKMTSSR